MSILFGIYRLSGDLVHDQQLRMLSGPTLQYAPEGTFVMTSGCTGMGIQPCHTTSCATREDQPRCDCAGNLLTFDGRLDNHDALGEMLHIDDSAVSDSELILAAYRQWNEECFRYFVGDWALALWSSRNRHLYLARDHAGTRTLYFQEQKGSLAWATYVDTFFADGAAQTIDETFIAGYLAGMPKQGRTPYAGIRSVPPAHVLIVSERGMSIKRHWNYATNDRIRYKSSGDYDAHFLHLFGQAVARRTSPGYPILAQLSGGMDSTAIVCMSDHMRRQADSSSPLLDTISYYDDTESSWDEKPYFTITETQRGKVGFHVDVSVPYRSFLPAVSASGKIYYRWPGFDKESWEHEHQLYKRLEPSGYRVLLSGIGGDELLGGVPTPLPELSDSLMAGNLVGFIRKATGWCIQSHTPIHHMLGEVLRATCTLYFSLRGDRGVPPSWMSPRLSRILYGLSSDAAYSGTIIGLRPSAIYSGRAWMSVLESLPSHNPEFFSRYEYRYPYLDRDLVDFLLRVPREQLVQPGRRRAMMRRALAGIVPEEVLERKRKGFIARQPIVALQNSSAAIHALFADPLVAANGWINPEKLQRSIELITSGQDAESWPALLRLAAIELFLQSGAATSTHPGTEQLNATRGNRSDSPLFEKDAAFVEEER